MRRRLAQERSESASPSFHAEDGRRFVAIERVEPGVCGRGLERSKCSARNQQVRQQTEWKSG
jgi:hypothetical protein